MLRNPIPALCTTALLCATASAQFFCTDNQYPVRLVDSLGVPASTFVNPSTGETTFQLPTEAAYLAFDPQLPSGTYYVHVTDTPIDGMDEVVSLNDPMDRFVTVTNNAGVITLSLPFTNGQTPPGIGLGLNGVGQSLLLSPFRRSIYSGCSFKAWYGDKWDLTYGPDNPYLLDGGIHPTSGLCAVRSYSSFRIGNGIRSDVFGHAFADQDHDGVRDAGEGPLANWEVRLSTGSTTLSTTTDAAGDYRFVSVPAGSYTVDFVLPANYLATTPTSFPIQVCECGDVPVPDFGAETAMLPCNARPICYWLSCQGLHKVQQFGILSQLPMLCLVNTCGHHVAPGNTCSFRTYLLFANEWNMAYALSAQLVAMHCNVAVGFVHPDCVIQDPCLGTLTIAQLLQQSVASLCAHPYTPPCSQHRLAQSRLRNALARANANLIWR